MVGKRKIEMKKRDTKTQRMVAFSKRRKSIFEKSHELHCLTGATTAVIAFSQAGRPYIHGDPSFDSALEQYFHRISLVQEKEKEVEEQQYFCDHGYCKEAEMRAWLESIRVDGCYDLDQLVFLKNQLEEIKLNIIQDEFVGSLLA